MDGGALWQQVVMVVPQQFEVTTTVEVRGGGDVWVTLGPSMTTRTRC